MGGPLGLESWQVACRSGWTYADRPQALFQDGVRLEIQEIEGMWRGPQGRHFMVRVEDRGRFHLVYLEAEDRWLVEMA